MKTLNSTSSAQRRAHAIRRTKTWTGRLDTSTRADSFAAGIAAVVNAIGMAVALDAADRGRAPRDVLQALTPSATDRATDAASFPALVAANLTLLARYIDETERSAASMKRMTSVLDALADRRAISRTSGGGESTGVAPPAMGGLPAMT